MGFLICISLYFKAVAQSLKVLSLHCSICWQPDRTRSEHFVKHFIDRICLI